MRSKGISESEIQNITVQWNLDTNLYCYFDFTEKFNFYLKENLSYPFEEFLEKESQKLFGSQFLIKRRQMNRVVPHRWLAEFHAMKGRNLLLRLQKLTKMLLLTKAGVRKSYIILIAALNILSQNEIWKYVCFRNEVIDVNQVESF